MTEHRGYEVLATGEWGRVLGVRTPKGECPVLEWLQSLEDRQQAAIKARLDQLAVKGTLRAPEQFRKLDVAGDPSVFEVKHAPQNLRVYVIKGNRTYYATHGGSKPKKNAVKKEVEKARRIYKEWQT